ncbi:MAG: SMP-30/gluconolactonase/LRE family protein [Chloroflexi bacterium]|nr:SMP-30/gluconolactonase/LRE family protein [Chloroflexota bacterium]
MRTDLGEGPIWSIERGELAIVDILERRILILDPSSGDTATIRAPAPVGAVAFRQVGGLVAALEDGFWAFDGPTGWRSVAAVQPVGGDRRFNDGKCDPQGRFWAGTMAYDGSPGAGSLYRLDIDLSASAMVHGITTSNGLAWTRDGATMFYIDTPTHRIDAFEFDPAGGTIGGRRVAVDLAAFAGSPDGLTIDAEDGLWVAMWGGAAVHRFADGRLDRTIRLPVSQPTSCTFGGPNLDELYITSASYGLSDAALRAEPLAGSLFRTRPGVAGSSGVAFAG